MVTFAGLLFALAIWGVVLYAIYRKIPLRFSIPLFVFSGFLVGGSNYVVEDYENWGLGLTFGLALAIAIFVSLDLRRRRSG